MPFIINTLFLVTLFFYEGQAGTGSRNIVVAAKGNAIPPKIREVTPGFVFLEVPFTSQAPLGQWRDSRFQNGCEEAAILMAMAWARGIKNLRNAEVESRIVSLTKFEEKLFSFADDTSAGDTAKLAEAYFGYKKIRVRQNIHTSDIKDELLRKNLVIAPVNGQKLNNPFYTPPGPARHMLVIIGYDPWSKEFVVHDPGTKRGKNMRYSEETIENALRDYPSGSHEPIKDIRKNMIVVEQLKP